MSDLIVEANQLQNTKNNPITGLKIPSTRETYNINK